jgi:hypothetical protein
MLACVLCLPGSVPAHPLGAGCRGGLPRLLPAAGLAAPARRSPGPRAAV